MEKLASGDYIDGDKLDGKSSMSTINTNLDPKVVGAYKKVGVVM